VSRAQKNSNSTVGQDINKATNTQKIFMSVRVCVCVRECVFMAYTERVAEVATN